MLTKAKAMSRGRSVYDQFKAQISLHLYNWPLAIFNKNGEDEKGRKDGDVN